MSIRNFSPLAVGIFVAACAATHFSRIVPVAPVAILVFGGLVGIAFQLEDGKLIRMFHEILDAFHNDRVHHVH